MGPRFQPSFQRMARAKLTRPWQLTGLGLVDDEGSQREAMWKGSNVRRPVKQAEPGPVDVSWCLSKRETSQSQTGTPVALSTAVLVFVDGFPFLRNKQPKKPCFPWVSKGKLDHVCLGQCVSYGGVSIEGSPNGQCGQFSLALIGPRESLLVRGVANSLSSVPIFRSASCRAINVPAIPADIDLIVQKALYKTLNTWKLVLFFCFSPPSTIDSNGSDMTLTSLKNCVQNEQHVPFQMITPSCMPAR